MLSDEARVVDVNRDTVEYVRARWYANVNLDSQPVEIRVAPLDWLPGEWEGDDPVATRVLRTADPMDFSDLGLGLHDVYARMTDSPEVPAVRLGQYRVTG
jgi:hypothetical protein